MSKPSAKASKESVKYGRGSMRDHCSVCTNYEPPNACAKVLGKIDPSAWCRLFARKKATATK